MQKGFRFQVLFLDPTAPDHVIASAHRDADLRQKLQDGLDQAAGRLKDAGLNPAEHLKLYRFSRTMTMAIVDQAILYTPISVDSQGRARPLTRAPFELLSAQSEHGSDMLQTFETYWEDATPWQPP